ncbi:MAG: shikimate dehydrogenase [Chloroflexi bacterium]|nr:shikimate dehydrogenase [Chloroflexota bacterium]
MMRVCGVIGQSLKHSISAAFQQAAFDALGLDVRYHAWELSPEAIPSHLARLRQVDALGANVTIPYKLAVLDFIDERDPLVERVGAANTLVNNQGRLAAYNTDVGGFLQALRQDLHADPSGQHALVLGAGGAAHAVAIALLDSGAATLTLASRTFERAKALVQMLNSESRVIAIPWDLESLQSAVGRASMIVNTTPLGMLGPLQEETPLPHIHLPARILVFDLVANPLKTRLMREATAQGARAIGGLPMLIYQGAQSFELWTGNTAPLTVMFEAAAAQMQASSPSKGGI